MATGKKPDPRKRKIPALHATYLVVKNGEKHPGYKAGELYGCYTHRTYAAQPCLSNITDDELECPFCKASMIPEWRGYVPLWDRDWTLRYVLIGEDYFATTDAIGFHEQVSVSRGKNPISPLVIRAESMLTRKLPQTPPWSSAVNMLEICLTLWKSDALNQWMKLNKPLALADAAVAASPPPAPPPAAVVKPAMGVAPYTPPDKEKRVGDGVTEVMERTRRNFARVKNGSNGTGHK